MRMSLCRDQNKKNCTWKSENCAAEHQTEKLHVEGVCTEHACQRMCARTCMRYFFVVLNAWCCAFVFVQSLYPNMLASDPFHHAVFFEVATPQDEVSVGTQVLHGLFVAITKRTLPNPPESAQCSTLRHPSRMEAAPSAESALQRRRCSKPHHPLVPRALKNVLPPPVHVSWATHSQTHCDAQELGLRGTSEPNTFQHSQRRSMTAVTDSASEYHIRFWSRRCELELLRAASTCQCRSASREEHGTPPSVSRRTCLQFIDKGTKEKQGS